MAARPVGVLGATGAVGRVAARTLYDRGVPLRLGSRHAGPPPLPVETVRVDAADPAALTGFAAGCAVVLDCTGVPGVAAAAVAAGAAYVSPSGGADGLAGEPVPVPAVLAAGWMPGLTGLLPRLLTADLDPGGRLVAYTGGLDAFTPAAARDYVAAVAGDGAAGAAWRGGCRVRRALPRVTGAEVPFCPGRVTLQPVLTGETERLAAAAGLADVSWYSVFAGGAVLDALTRPAADPDRWAAELVAAAEVDRFGRDPYHVFVAQAEGTVRGVPVVRGFVLRATGASALTGVAAALATGEVLRGACPPGRHLAADCLDPGAVATRLAGTGPVLRWDRVVGRFLVAAPVPGALVEVGAL